MPVPYLQLIMNFNTAEPEPTNVIYSVFGYLCRWCQLFFGAVLGAILFTILQTVIGLQKDFKSHKAA